MQTSEQRVAVLENRVGEHNVMMTAIVDAIGGIDRRMAAFEARVDRRFEGIDRRFEGIDRKFEGIDAKLSKLWFWIVGIQISVLVAILAVVAGA